MRSAGKMPDEEKHNFDQYGCSKLLPQFPYMEQVIKESAESQARLADVVTVANANDSNWNEQQLRKVRQDFPFDVPDNVTGVGNMAYMATSDRVPEQYRQEWQTIARAYQLRLELLESTARKRNRKHKITCMLIGSLVGSVLGGLMGGIRSEMQR